MNVEDIMTRQVKTCWSNESLNRAAQLMWENDCGCIPVVDEGKPIAVVTDRDICMAAYTQGKPLADICVSSAASRGVVTVRQTDGLDVVEAVMRAHRIRRVPVVDLDGNLTGIVSMNDIARHHVLLGQHHHRRNGLGAESIVRTLAAICQPASELQPQSAQAAE